MLDGTHGEDEQDLDSDDDFDTQAAEVADDAASDTGEHTEDESPAEQDAKEAFELEEPEKETEDKGEESTKAEHRKKIELDSWEDKLKMGERTLDDLPAAQEWMRPELERRLGEETPEQKEQVDVKGVVKDAIRDDREAERFKVLKESLSRSSLSKAEGAAVNSEYKKYMEQGLSKALALEAAVGIAGVGSKILTPDKVETLRKNASIPGGGPLKPAPKDVSMEDIDKLVKQHGYGAVTEMVSKEKLDEYDLSGIQRDPAFK